MPAAVLATKMQNRVPHVWVELSYKIHNVSKLVNLELCLIQLKAYVLMIVILDSS